MMEKSTGVVSFGDCKVNYEVAGKGEPLVFLHAGFVDSRMWDDQWLHFSQHYSVIRFDMCGFGKSGRIEKPISRRQELYRVLEETGIRRATFVGCSLGGETILDVALQHPEMVSRLIVVSTAPGGFEMQGEPPPHLMEMLAAVERGDLALASELHMRIWVDGPLRQAEEVDAHVRQRALEMSRDALVKRSWGLALGPAPDPLDPPAVQKLDQIQAPTLIVAGELDHPEILRAAEVMASIIPGAQKAIIPECAHLPNMEKPAEFNKTVLDFLGGAEE